MFPYSRKTKKRIKKLVGMPDRHLKRLNDMISKQTKEECDGSK